MRINGTLLQRFWALNDELDSKVNYLRENHIIQNATYPRKFPLVF